MATAAPSSRLSTLLAPADGLLRLSLRLDAVVTGANGLAYLALSGLLDDLLGLDRAVALGIGVFLTVYALGVAATGATRRISPAAAGAVVVGNAAWAVLSVLAVVTGVLSLTAAGAVWAVLQALVVGGFAALQYLGLRRAR
ncbi:hypothetical protein ACWEVD_23680 [Nocardia thailandica]|uniref:Integral membrane protein n=1 Tax=Nocardia thailandica TaxID=257275 RepID=A0ABW6PJC9_9NOCA|nr:hypothetical protein [Nocardia thailandica]